MEVIRTVVGGGRRPPDPVLAVGNFDGVHRGHQAILARVLERAGQQGGTAAVLTFDPHPVQVLTPEHGLRLLIPLAERLRLLERAGIAVTWVVRFDRRFAEQKPAEFIERVLIGGIGAREVCIGQGFRFGRGREGGPEDLRRIGEAGGLSVWVVPPVIADGEPISSSRIRRILEEGRVEEAAGLLGRPHAIEATVVRGAGRGAALGFPTANFDPPEEMIPGPGVYAARGAWKSELRDGIVYIGSQPTFGGGRRRIELHLPGFSGNLYGERVRIEFLGQVRGEVHFPGPEALVAQIRKDLETARRIAEATPRTG